MKTPRVLEVHWLDTSSSGGWHKRGERGEIKKPLKCVSIGYLYERNSDCIVLFQSMEEQGKCNDTVTIPTGCISKVRRLR